MNNYNFKSSRLRQVVAAVLAATTAFAPLAHAQTETYSYRKYVEGLPSEVPAGGASPSILDFGEVQIPGSSTWQTVTYSNLGNTDLSIGEITAPTGFEVQSNCPANLVAKQTCTMQVRFAPTTPGVASGTVSIASSSYSSPDLVAVAALGTQPVAHVSPGTVNLGDVNVGAASAPVNLSVTNTGTGILQLSNLTFGGSAQGFAVTEGTCSPLPKQLGSQESCAMTVNVTPNSTGPLSGVVNISTNDAAGSHSVPLQAVGVQAAISLSQASLDFGDVLSGTTSASQTLTVTNNGSGALDVITVGPPVGVNAGEFSTTNTCGALVAPNGGTCTISVTAAPTSKGSKTASIQIVSNAPTSPTVVSLSANATQGTVSVDPASWDFGTVTVN